MARYSVPPSPVSVVSTEYNFDTLQCWCSATCIMQHSTLACVVYTDVRFPLRQSIHSTMSFSFRLTCGTCSSLLPPLWYYLTSSRTHSHHIRVSHVHVHTHGLCRRVSACRPGIPIHGHCCSVRSQPSRGGCVDKHYADTTASCTPSFGGESLACHDGCVWIA